MCCYLSIGENPLSRRTKSYGAIWLTLLAIEACDSTHKESHRQKEFNEKTIRQTASAHIPCPSSWSTIQSSDSLIAVCLPVGFQEVPLDSSMKKKFRKSPVYVLMQKDSTKEPASVIIKLWIPQYLHNDYWPPSLPHENCKPSLFSSSVVYDCVQTDDLQVREDSVLDGVAHVETGLLSRDQQKFPTPTLVAGWNLGQVWAVEVRIETVRVTTLDALRRFTLPTIRVTRLTLDKPTTPP